MPNYQKMYTCLFNAATDALRSLDALNIGVAKDLLIRAQQQTEEMYMDEEEDDTLA